MHESQMCQVELELERERAVTQSRINIMLAREDKQAARIKEAEAELARLRDVLGEIRLLAQCSDNLRISYLANRGLAAPTAKDTQLTRYIEALEALVSTDIMRSAWKSASVGAPAVRD